MNEALYNRDGMTRPLTFALTALPEAQIQDPEMRKPAMDLAKMQARDAMDAARDLSANRPGALFPLYRTLIGFMPEGASDRDLAAMFDPMFTDFVTKPARGVP